MSFKYVLRLGGKNPSLTQILYIWFDYLGFPPPKDKANWQALGGEFTVETRDMVTRFQQKYGIVPLEGKPYGQVTAVEWQRLGKQVGFKAFDAKIYNCIWEGNQCPPDPFAIVNFLKKVGGYQGNALSGGINIYAPRFIEMYAEEFGGFNGDVLYGIGAFLNFMRTDENLTDVRHVAYMMATVFKETGRTWQPVEETDGASKVYGKLREVTCGGNKYTNRYYGRGYVQLTVWGDRENNGGIYNEVSQKLGMGCDLVANPDLVKQPLIAYKILSRGMKDGWFRKDETLAKYIYENVCDYEKARSIINSRLLNSKEIDGYAKTFEAMIRATMFS